jgi:hypothetical protein
MTCWFTRILKKWVLKIFEVTKDYHKENKYTLSQDKKCDALHWSIVRGNNRAEIFCTDADYDFYLEKLKSA